MLTLALPLVALTMTGGAAAGVGAPPPLRLLASEAEKSWSGASGPRSPDLATVAAAISERAAKGSTALRPPPTAGGGRQPGGLELGDQGIPPGTKVAGEGGAGEAGQGAPGGGGADRGAAPVARSTWAMRLARQGARSSTVGPREVTLALDPMLDRLIRQVQVTGGGPVPRLLRNPAPPLKVPLGTAGLIAAFGDAPALGAPGPGGRDLVSVAVSPQGRGYWAVDADGAVFAYGDARSYGSLLGDHPAGGIAAMAATPDGKGYWVASRDGGVFTFGDATFYQSLGLSSLASAVVGIAPTPDGHGYWLATANGGVYTFGDARYFGSLGQVPSGSPVIGIASSPHGDGYWLASAGGGVFSFGNAKFFGSLSSSGTRLSAIAGARRGQGYWLLSTNGVVHGFGAAANYGSARTSPDIKASALAPTGDGGGYVMGTMQTTTSAASAGAQRTYLGTFMVTCYDLTGITASGAQAGPESAAVDPGVIALGTRIYIDGVGERTADDTGGAIIGQHIDIWEPSYTQCVNWGVRERAVYRVG